MVAFLCGEPFYDMEKVKVKVIRKIPEIKVGGETLGPLDQDQEVELERWVARVLKEEGYVDIIDEKDVDLSLISKIAWKEVRTDQLVPLEPTFYVKARRYLKILNEKAKVNPEALNEKRAVEVKLTDVINCRIQKIVNLALTGSKPPREVLDSLTPEEKMLFNEVRYLISRWRRTVKGE
ncbi:MAG: hypothetical protein QXQ03_04790, partial [Candidatus Nezhaarchaeales archaeon]